MRTRTLESSVESPSTERSIQREISEQVDERGFYLYNWISPEELRMSVQADYLSIVKWTSIPLMIVTLIAGFIGLAAGIFGVIFAVFGVLTVFYAIVFITLVVKMMRKSYMYTRGADVVITDDHYVTSGRVLEKSDFEGQKEAFHVMERIFREPLFEPSELREYVELEKKNLFEQLKDIALGGGKVIQNVGRSRDAGPIIMVLLIAGVLYGGMMALVYSLGVFFVAILARVFSWIADRVLLATNNTEHTIQDLFGDITDASIGLKAKKKESMSLITEAGRNEWAKNLSSRLESSFEEINTMAGIATDKTLKLRDILENSQYKKIFNFSKYGNWMKTQVLEPIEEIYELLTNQRKILEKTLTSIDSQIIQTSDSSLKKHLELQKDRIEIQLESFDRMIHMLEGYRAKLTP